MRATVLMNPAAGPRGSPRRRPEDVESALRDAGTCPTVRVVPPAHVAAAARDAVDGGADAVVAAGGDGTVAAVAAALVDRPTPLGVLPLGTFNHFAKDLGLPLELDAAAGVVAAGNVRRVDVADVDGRTFVNNASIGLYPQLVVERERLRERAGIGKWGAMLFAALAVFRRHPDLRVRIAAGGRAGPVALTTPFVFVGNNPYHVRLLAVAGRSHLDRGELCLYVVTGSGRLRLVRLALAALTGSLDQSRDFASACPRECWIGSARSRLRVALDGEVTFLSPPLHFRSRPLALRVLAPPPPPAAEEAE